MENDNVKLKVKGVPINLLIAGGSFILMIISPIVIPLTSTLTLASRVISFFLFLMITIIFSSKSIKLKESKIIYSLIGLVFIGLFFLGLFVVWVIAFGLACSGGKC